MPRFRPAVAALAAAQETQGGGGDPDRVVATLNGEEIALAGRVAVRAEPPAQNQSISEARLLDGPLSGLAVPNDRSGLGGWRDHGLIAP